MLFRSPRTGLLIDSVSVQGLIPAIVGDVNRKSAPPVINDIDNDGNMEYLFGTKSLGLGLGIIHLFALDENLNYLWHIEHIQVESSVLPVVFDLEGDGTKEIITRGAYASFGSNGLPYLYVIDAVTGVRKDSIYAEHGTRFGADGGPIIADVDNDGMVEIITTGKLSPSGTMELAVISSNTNRWACGRRVWNQVNYHPTLINDNLTVPAQPQNIAYLPIEYNGNSIQASFKDVNGNYACPMPDVVVTIDSNSYSVNCDSLIIHTTICNIGDGSITGGLCNIPKYVSIYNGNPSSGGVLFQTDTLSCALDSSGSCVSYNQTIFTGGLSFTLFIVVNDSGVNPLSAPNIFFAECDTTNNMDMLFVISPCGNIIPPLNTAICEGDSVLLIASGSTNGYNWVDSLTFTPILATDSFYMASPIATTTYAIYSTTDTAYVTVTVDSAYSFSVSQTICQGDSIQLPGGSYVSTTGLYSDLLTSSTGCDSVIITNLLVISPIVNSVSLSICAGDSIIINGNTYASTGIYIDTIIATNGCDSIITTILEVYNTTALQTTSDTTIMLGGSVTLLASGSSSYLWSTGSNGNSISVSPEETTTYFVTGTDTNGCTSTQSVTVTITMDFNLYVPNAFSPSSNKSDNKRLYVFGKNIVTMEFAIYDRWGEIVFQTSDVSASLRQDGLCCKYGKGWNGTYENNGKKLNSGVFAYKLIGHFVNGEAFVESGNITLIW